MSLETPRMGPRAGKNMEIIMVRKPTIWEEGIIFHTKLVTPPLSPSKASIRPMNFCTTAEIREGIFLIVAFVLSLTLSQNDF